MATILMYIFNALWIPLLLNIWLPVNVKFSRRALHFFTLFSIFIIGLISFPMTEKLWLVMFPLMCLTTYTILKCSLVELIYLPLAYLSIVLCTNSIETVILYFVKKPLAMLYQQVPYSICILSLCTFVIVIFGFLTRTIIRKAISFIQNEDYREMAILVCANVILCTIVFLVNLYYVRSMGYPLKAMIATMLVFALYVILTLVLTLVMFHVFRERSRMRFEMEQQKQLEEYTKQMETMNEKLRSFKHDYTNILLSIYGYIQDGDMDGLSEHFQKEILPTNAALNQDNYRLSQLSHIQDKGIKGLLSSKLMQAHEKGIDVYIDIIEDIRPLPVKTVDFTRVLGIFLDNAIEAALECEQKRIELNLIQNPDSMVLTLRNTFKNTGFSISQMRKRGVSSKGDSRGLGLANVEEILSHYSNIENMTEIQDVFFMQQLIVRE